MKHLHLPHRHSLLLACCLAAAFPAAQAADTTTTTTSTTTAVGTSANTEAKLSAEFAGFLGGEEQAATVVSGLRQGSTFSLTQTTTGTNGTTSTTTTIDPPTGTMGYGNVRITLRLAQAELNQMGITNPTPEQLSAALVGGTINGTQVNGILTQRAEGMGWGQIAQQYGVTVGQIMGKGAGLTNSTATGAKTTGGTTSASSSMNKPAPASSSAHSNGYIPSGKPAGAGIVTGAGSSSVGAGNSDGKSQANKAGSAVSAGGHASATGVSNAGGSSATAPGQVKKD